MPSFFGVDTDQLQKNAQNIIDQKRAAGAQDQYNTGRTLAGIFTGGLSELGYQGVKAANGGDPTHEAFVTAGQKDAANAQTIRDGIGTYGGDGTGAGGAGANGGLVQSSMPANAGGFAGFFGGEKDYPIYVPRQINDPNYQGNRAQLATQLANASNMPSASMRINSVDPTNEAQWRAQQMSFAQQLRDQADGRGGPTVADLQLQRGTDQNMKQALSMALAARGSNQISALRQAGDQRADAAQAGANQAAQLRMQEQLAARQQLGQVVDTARGQDLGMATTNAQLEQQARQANLTAQLQSQQQRDQRQQWTTQQLLGLDQGNVDRQVQQAQFSTGALNQAVAASNNVSTQNSAQGMQVAGAGIGAVGALAAALSDEREKTDVKDASADLSDFLGKLGTHAYKYKDPDKPLRGHGEFVSPMAQELEKSKIGKSMVVEAPDGTKVVNYGKGFGSLLAALAMHEKRLARVEEHA